MIPDGCTQSAFVPDRPQPNGALDFYPSVAATRYLREGEQFLATPA